MALGQGDHRALRAFARMTKFDGVLVTDLQQPSLPAYRALGAHRKGKDDCSFIFEQAVMGTYHGIRSAWFQGHSDLAYGVIKSNFLIQGGCVLFDEACRPLYTRMFTRVAERWPIVDLVEHIRRADEASTSADRM